MRWLRTPSGFGGVSSDDDFLQRYALATLYYSAGGDGWAANDGWLTDASACKWFSSSGRWPCDDDGMIVELNLPSNGLVGSLPNEIGILSQLRTITLSGNFELSGPIPNTLRNLPNLQRLLIEGTALTSLPPEVCDLPSLKDFWADCEEIGGCSCCDRCFF